MKNFRRLHSKTAATPEVGVTPAWNHHQWPVGQGNHQCGGHGAGREAAGRRNQPRRATPSSTTTPNVFAGRRLPDGRHQPRGSRRWPAPGSWALIALYDDNGISIDGRSQPWFVDNTAQLRGTAGNVIGPVDGTTPSHVSPSPTRQEGPDKPHADRLQDHIGRKGSPNCAGQGPRGAPWAQREIKLTREARSAGFSEPVIPEAAYGTPRTGEGPEAPGRRQCLPPYRSTSLAGTEFSAA